MAPCRPWLTITIGMYYSHRVVRSSSTLHGQHYSNSSAISSHRPGTTSLQSLMKHRTKHRNAIKQYSNYNESTSASSRLPNVSPLEDVCKSTLWTFVVHGVSQRNASSQLEYLSLGFTLLASTVLSRLRSPSTWIPSSNFNYLTCYAYIHRSEYIIPTLLVYHWPDKRPVGHTLVHAVMKAIEARGRRFVQLQNMKKRGRRPVQFVLTFVVARSVGAFLPWRSRVLIRGGREVATCEAGGSWDQNAGGGGGVAAQNSTIIRAEANTPDGLCHGVRPRGRCTPKTDAIERAWGHYFIRGESDTARANRTAVSTVTRPPRNISQSAWTIAVNLSIARRQLLKSLRDIVSLISNIQNAKASSICAAMVYNLYRTHNLLRKSLGAISRLVTAQSQRNRRSLTPDVHRKAKFEVCVSRKAAPTIDPSIPVLPYYSRGRFALACVGTVSNKKSVSTENGDWPHKTRLPEWLDESGSALRDGARGQPVGSACKMNSPQAGTAAELKEEVRMRLDKEEPYGGEPCVRVCGGDMAGWCGSGSGYVDALEGYEWEQRAASAIRRVKRRVTPSDMIGVILARRNKAVRQLSRVRSAPIVPSQTPVREHGPGCWVACLNVKRQSAATMCCGAPPRRRAIVLEALASTARDATRFVLYFVHIQVVCTHAERARDTFIQRARPHSSQIRAIRAEFLSYLLRIFCSVCGKPKMQTGEQGPRRDGGWMMEWNYCRATVGHSGRRSRLRCSEKRRANVLHLFGVVNRKTRTRLCAICAKHATHVHRPALTSTVCQISQYGDGKEYEWCLPENKEKIKLLRTCLVCLSRCPAPGSASSLRRILSRICGGTALSPNAPLQQKSSILWGADRGYSAPACATGAAHIDPAQHSTMQCNVSARTQYAPTQFFQAYLTRTHGSPRASTVQFMCIPDCSEQSSQKTKRSRRHGDIGTPGARRKGSLLRPVGALQIVAIYLEGGTDVRFDQLLWMWPRWYTDFDFEAGHPVNLVHLPDTTEYARGDICLTLLKLCGLAMCAYNPDKDTTKKFQHSKPQRAKQKN
ncbi:hypothetical protein BDW22DRAFT_1346215 [Trametopsis cervina]|nr:hypothetical protein BDW22DRAFT_1346215 [Trametopsis cervina]